MSHKNVKDKYNGRAFLSFSGPPSQDTQQTCYE